MVDPWECTNVWDVPSYLEKRTYYVRWFDSGRFGFANHLRVREAGIRFVYLMPPRKCDDALRFLGTYSSGSLRSG